MNAPSSLMLDLAMIAIFLAALFLCAVWLEWRENKRVRRIIQEAIREAKEKEMEKES